MISNKYITSASEYGVETRSTVDCSIDFLMMDCDNDGLINEREVNLSTDPYGSDTDGDGLMDWEEVDVYGTDPHMADSDSDGLFDGQEVKVYLTSPIDADADVVYDHQIYTQPESEYLLTEESTEPNQLPELVIWVAKWVVKYIVTSNL